MSDATLKPIDPAAALDFAAGPPTLGGVTLNIYGAARKALYKAVTMEVTRDPSDEATLAEIDALLEAKKEVPAELSEKLFRRRIAWPMNALLLVWTLTLTVKDVGRFSCEPSAAWPAFLEWAAAQPAALLKDMEAIASKILSDERRAEVVPTPAGAAPPAPKA